MSNYQVSLSLIAELKLQSILDYLELEWSAKVKNEFLNSFIDLTNQISRFPRSCPEYDEISGIFKAIINKNISFHYQIKNDQEIEIISVFDNRQDPNEIEKEISLFV